MKEDDRPTATEEKLSRQTLVLNRAFLPIQMTTVRHAVELLFQERARVVTADYLTFNLDEWIVNSTLEKSAKKLADSDMLSGVSAVIAVPKVIMLTDYDTIPKRTMRFRRRDVFARDNYTCQYCAKSFIAEQLTIDHILPRAKGGTSTWTNCVASCKPCNTFKADRTPDEANMPLINGVPKKPNPAFHFTQKLQGDATWNRFV